MSDAPDVEEVLRFRADKYLEDSNPYGDGLIWAGRNLVIDQQALIAHLSQQLKEAQALVAEAQAIGPTMLLVWRFEEIRAERDALRADLEMTRTTELELREQLRWREHKGEAPCAMVPRDATHISKWHDDRVLIVPIPPLQESSDAAAED